MRSVPASFSISAIVRLWQPSRPVTDTWLRKSLERQSLEILLRSTVSVWCETVWPKKIKFGFPKNSKPHFSWMGTEEYLYCFELWSESKVVDRPELQKVETVCLVFFRILPKPPSQVFVRKVECFASFLGLGMAFPSSESLLHMVNKKTLIDDLTLK